MISAHAMDPCVYSTSIELSWLTSATAPIQSALGADVNNSCWPAGRMQSFVLKMVSTCAIHDYEYVRAKENGTAYQRAAQPTKERQNAIQLFLSTNRPPAIFRPFTRLRVTYDVATATIHAFTQPCPNRPTIKQGAGGFLCFPMLSAESLRTHLE